MKNLAFWMELNTPMKILTFCISSFQSSYFAFCISYGTKHSLNYIIGDICVQTFDGIDVNFWGGGLQLLLWRVVAASAILYEQPQCSCT
jgi:hypothetical protein